MSSSLPQVVLVYPLPDRAAQDRLSAEGFAVTVLQRDDDETVHAAVVGADAVILHGPARLTARTIEAAPRLRVIGALGAGTDNIDVDAARRQGVELVTGAGVAPRAVAEFVIGASIAAHRNLVGLHRLTAAGELTWNTRFREHAGMSLYEHPFGVVGLGNIGREVARLARAVFDAPILAFDPHVPGPPPPGVVLLPTVDEVFAGSDTVTINAALTPDTHHLVRREQLRLLGPGGVLIDAARGGLVHEGDLVAALEAREIKGAVLDVFDPEPPPADRLRRLASVPGLVLSPHIAGSTRESQRALSESVVQKVTQHLQAPPRAGTTLGGT